jgi:hypothetical protein
MLNVPPSKALIVTARLSDAGLINPDSPPMAAYPYLVPILTFVFGPP